MNPYILLCLQLNCSPVYWALINNQINQQQWFQQREIEMYNIQHLNEMQMQRFFLDNEVRSNRNIYEQWLDFEQ